MTPLSMHWVMEVVLGSKTLIVMNLRVLLMLGLGSAVVQVEGHLPLLPGEDHVLLVKPVVEEVASHPGILVGVEHHW